ncbi:MAG: hypothetical protein K8S87_01955, partial [Planctomycetes bacterium]|nr:hypothetical protein [Planctomycetota bacterium]
DSHAGMLRKMYSDERMDFLKTFVTVWEPERMQKLRTCQDETEKKIIWDEIFQLHRNLRQLGKIISKFTAFSSDNRYSTVEDVIVDLEDYLDSFDQKQVELLRTSFLEEVVHSDDVVQDNNHNDSKSNIIDIKTAQVVNKLSFIKTHTGSPRLTKFAKPLPKKIVAPKLTRQTKTNVEHQQNVREKALDKTQLRRRQKNRTNTQILVGVVVAVLGVVIIYIMFGDSSAQNSLDTPNDSKSKDKTVAVDQYKSNTAAYTIQDVQHPESKLDKIKLEKPKVIPEVAELNDKQSRRERDFRNAKRKYKIAVDILEDSQHQLKNPKSEAFVALESTLQKQWISLMKEINAFKEHEKDFNKFLKSGSLSWGKARFYVIIGVLALRWMEKDIYIISVLEDSSILDKQSNAFMTLKDADKQIGKVLEVSTKLLLKSDKIINDYLKVARKITESKELISETKTAYAEAKKEYTTLKRTISKLEKEISRLGRIMEARKNKYNLEARNYQRYREKVNVVGKEERPFVISAMKQCLKRMEKAYKEYQEAEIAVDEVKSELETQVLDQEEYEETMLECEKELKEAEKVDIKELEKRTESLYKDMIKQKVIISSEFTNIEKALSNYHITFCIAIKEIRNKLNIQIKQLDSKIESARKKVELCLGYSNTNYSNITRFVEAVDSFNDEVKSYAKAVSKSSILLGVSLGGLIERKFTDIVKSFQETE